MTGGAHFTIDEGLMPTTLSLPVEHSCHYITDDELRRLGEMRKDLVMEICLASAGIFFGALIPAWAGLGRFNADPVTATGIDLLSIVLCFSAAAAALITGYQWKVRSAGHVDLVTEIRSRPKISVRLVHDDAA